MKRVTANIDSCTKCPYRSRHYWDSVVGTWRTVENGCSLEGRTIEVSYPIPSWCPLPASGGEVPS